MCQHDCLANSLFAVPQLPSQFVALQKAKVRKQNIQKSANQSASACVYLHTDAKINPLPTQDQMSQYHPVQYQTLLEHKNLLEVRSLNNHVGYTAL